MKDKHGLTLRQRKFVKETIKTMNPTEAVKRSYNIGGKGGKINSTKIAGSIATENLNKPVIRKRFDEILETIDDDVIVQRFYEILKDTDKRASLDAGDKLLKLKDRYPKGKTKIIGLFERIDSMREED